MGGLLGVPSGPLQDSAPLSPTIRPSVLEISTFKPELQLRTEALSLPSDTSPAVYVLRSPCLENAPELTPSSWSDIVQNRGNTPSPALKFFPPQAVEGDIVRISPPPEALQQSQLIWKSTLLGCFSGKGLHFHAVANIARRIWQRHDLCHVAESANGLFLFRFSSDEKSDEVLARAPWTFRGKSLLLKRWLPGMPLPKENFNSCPVWFKLQNVPAEFWTSLVLATKRSSSLVNSTLVEVEYAWKPTWCRSCHFFGHCVPQCKSKDFQFDVVAESPKVCDMEVSFSDRVGGDQKLVSGLVDASLDQGCSCWGHSLGGRGLL